MKFTQTFNVVSGEVDRQCLVNNVVYVRSIQDIAVCLWIAVTNQSVGREFARVVLRHEY